MGELEEGWCNTEESGIGKTSAVGIFEKGNTPEGVADLSGNVWEWTRSDYHGEISREDFIFDEEVQKLWKTKNAVEYFKKLDEKERQLPSLRGGSWKYYRGLAGCANRSRNAPNVRNYGIGFRCARTLKAVTSDQ